MLGLNAFSCLLSKPSTRSSVFTGDQSVPGDVSGGVVRTHLLHPLVHPEVSLWMKQERAAS